MDENLTRGYCQLGPGTSKKVEIVTSSSNDTPRGRSCYHSRTLPPLDHNRIVYLSLVVCGAGFLLPYNTFIVSVDYFRLRFPALTAIIDINVTYVCLAFAGVAIVNNLLTETLDLRLRIVVGYVTSAATLATVAMADVWFGVFKMADSYSLNLIAVAILAVGCTVQQHSFYVYTRILPRRYTQAVMIGESTAGLLASVLRVMTKLIIDDIRLNTFIFIVIVVVILLVCCTVFLAIVQTDFVQFYVQLYLAAQKDDEDRSSVDGTTTDEFQHDSDVYGVIIIQSPTCAPLPTTTTTTTTTLHSGNTTTTTTTTMPSLALPVSSAQTGHVINQAASASGTKEVTRKNRRSTGGKVERVTRKLMEVIEKDIGSWCYVCKCIWPYMFCVWLTYGITLSLFPGIVTEVISCRLTHWTPLVLLTTFNLFDCIGKTLTSCYYDWSGVKLALCALLRLSLIPAMMTALAPNANAVFSSEAWSIALTAVIGVTNGYFGNVSMITAPTRVLDTKKPLAGKVMTLSYTLGLAAGSAFAYCLHSLLVVQTDPNRNCEILIPDSNTSSTSLHFLHENSTAGTYVL